MASLGWTVYEREVVGNNYTIINTIIKIIINTIEFKRFLCYGYLERTKENKWPKRMLKWTPLRKKKNTTTKNVYHEQLEHLKILKIQNKVRLSEVFYAVQFCTLIGQDVNARKVGIELPSFSGSIHKLNGATGCPQIGFVKFS